MVAAWLIGAELSAIRAAAAGHHFQALDFLAHGLVEDDVGQEDKPVRAGVGVSVLARFAGAEYARLCGVHSASPFLWAGSRGVASTCGAVPLSDTLILHIFYTYTTLLRYNLADQ